MRYALLKIGSILVENVILMDKPIDLPGYYVVELKEDQYCTVGSLYDQTKGTFSIPKTTSQTSP